MKTLLIFRFFYYIDLLIVKIYVSYFEKKNDKDLTFNTVHFPKLEISTAL